MIKNVANAFNFIQRLYDETVTLVREIERLLGSEPECFKIGRPSGYSISTKGSNSLEQQNVYWWLTRRFAVFFVPERNVSMEMRHRFDLISVETQPPFGLNSRLQVD